MKLNIHLESFVMKDLSIEKGKFYFARDIGENSGNKQFHPVKKID